MLTFLRFNKQWYDQGAQPKKYVNVSNDQKSIFILIIFQLILFYFA